MVWYRHSSIDVITIAISVITFDKCHIFQRGWHFGWFEVARARARRIFTFDLSTMMVKLSHLKVTATTFNTIFSTTWITNQSRSKCQHWPEARTSLEMDGNLNLPESLWGGLKKLRSWCEVLDRTNHPTHRMHMGPDGTHPIRIVKKIKSGEVFRPILKRSLPEEGCVNTEITQVQFRCVLSGCTNQLSLGGN